MSTDNNLHQTYLKDCNCENGGIIIHKGEAVCRWCRTPYAKGGKISYKESHFKQEREWEIVRILRYDCEIHSVRRLSDGEVFTVGDMVSCGSITNKIIRKITIQPNGKLYIHSEGIYGFAEEGGFRTMQKVKQPVFTTEDGVQIMDMATTYWGVDKSFRMSSMNGLAWRKEDDSEKYFSTKEAAEEYILMNKPILSVNEMMSSFENWVLPPPNYVLTALKQLAEKKLSGL
jgi:hypothetical protein